MTQMKLLVVEQVKRIFFLLKTCLHPIFPCEKFFTLWVAMEYQLQKKYVMEKVSAL